MEKYTIETLRLRCKSKKLPNYSKLTRKEELYRYCILDESLESILASKSSKLKIESPETCALSEKEAGRCIKALHSLYPNVVKDLNLCTPLVEGPAIGVILDKGQVIGMINHSGEAIPIAPPLPPPPPNIIPIVKTKTINEKKELIKTLSEKIPTASMNDQLKEQILKGVELKKICTSGSIKTKNLTKHDILMESIKKGGILKKVDVEKSKEERLVEAQKRFGETEKGKFLSAIEKGVQLKKIKCDYGLIWDPRLKKCISLKENVSPKQASKAVTQTIEQVKKEPEGGLCNVM